MTNLSHSVLEKLTHPKKDMHIVYCDLWKLTFDTLHIVWVTKWHCRRLCAVFAAIHSKGRHCTFYVRSSLKGRSLQAQKIERVLGEDVILQEREFQHEPLLFLRINIALQGTIKFRIHFKNKTKDIKETCNLNHLSNVSQTVSKFTDWRLLEKLKKISIPNR